jgi:tetratricopeptide (TPR) repeat protein
MLGQVQALRGWVASTQGDAQLARDSLDEAVENAVRAGDHLTLAQAWLRQASVTVYSPNEALRAARIGAAEVELMGRPASFVGLVHEALGNALASAGRNEEAVREARLALAAARTRYGPEHPNVALSLYNLTGPLGDLGQYDEAARLGRQAAQMFEKYLGPNHPSVADALENASVGERFMGNLAQAVEDSSRALAIRASAQAMNSPEYATSWLNAASNRLAQAPSKSAVEEYLRAVALAKEVLPERTYALRLSAFGEDLLEAGMAGDARRPSLEAHAILGRELGDSHPETAEALGVVGRVELALGDYRRARTVLERALPNVRASGNHAAIAEQAFALARVLRALGEPEAMVSELGAEAERHFLAAGVGFEKKLAEVQSWGSKKLLQTVQGR